MKRLFARVAATLLVAPLLTTAVPTSAQAVDVTIPGCYGASTAVYCDITLSIPAPYTVETYNTTVPVCAGTCTDVPVTLVRLKSTGDDLAICVTWENRSGYPAGGVCTNSLDPIDPIDLDAYRALVADEYDDIVYTVCRGTATLRCSALLTQLLYTVSDVIRGQG